MSDTGDKRQLTLDIIYDLLHRRGSWPVFEVLDRRLDQAGLDSDAVLRSLPDGVLRGNPFAYGGFRPDQEVQLSILGLANASASHEDLELVIAATRWLAEVERAHDPDATGAPLTVTADEALAALGIARQNEGAAAMAGRVFVLLDLIPGIWSGRSAGSDPSGWSITVGRGIRRYRDLRDVEDLIARVRRAEGPQRTNDSEGTQSDYDEPQSTQGGVGREQYEYDVALTSYEYDVALTFAGEQRTYVEEVAGHLRAAGTSVFYDAFEKVALWGGNLVDRFAEVYGGKARYVVMFISKDYARKAWTNEERQHAQAAALASRRSLILPVRFDDTKIPGMPGTVAYLETSEHTPAELADVIVQKLRSADRTPAESKSPASTGPTGPRRLVAGRGRPESPPPPDSETRESWWTVHREAARRGLGELEKTDFYEVRAEVMPPLGGQDQRQLADAVRTANIETFGWPIGVYLPSTPPRPVQDGIVAEIKWAEKKTYDYWVVSRSGRFYLLKTLSEDALGAPDKLYFNTRVVRTAETILFLTRLYRELRASEESEITITVIHSGLRHRTLSAVGGRRVFFTDRRTVEDEVQTSATVRLADSEPDLVRVVKELLGPLFILYDYFTLSDEIYDDLIAKFRTGQVT